jgi:hypothetical protein
MAWKKTGGIAAQAPSIKVNSNIRVYLTGFSKREIRPKTRKDSQKDGGEKHGLRAFTMSPLTIVGSYAKRTML